MKRSRWLRLAVLLTPCLVGASACDRPEFTISDVPMGGTSSGSAGFVAGSVGTGGIVDMCAFERIQGTKAIFAAQTVNSNLPGRAELYALVTDAEAQALRDGGPLIPPADPMVQLDVVKLLDKILPVNTMARRQLIEQLKPRLSGLRVSWPNPWALRLVGHPGSEHMNAVRIVLRNDAWLAYIKDSSIIVVDTKNTTIPPDAAAADAGRIAAVFYEVNQRNSITLGVDPCEEGRREYAMANEAMVEEWSLGTPEILTRLDDDLSRLDEFFKVSRSCVTADKGSSFRSYTVCTTWPTYSVSSEYSAYQWTLATPNELYKPSPQNLAGLIEALQGDRFEPDDPYVVMPEPAAAGGAGGEGGAGFGGAGAGPN